LKTNFVLIDYENVRTHSASDLSVLKSEDFAVKLFLGVHDKMLSVDFVEALLPIGRRVEIIRLKASGANALDFHVAFYIGKLSCQKPESTFHIISKDRDYDALIKNLKTTGVVVHRHRCIADITMENTTVNDLVATTITALRKAAHPPSTQKKLRNAVDQLFKKELSEERLLELIAALSESGVVQIVGDKISYHLPELEKPQRAAISPSDLFT
jgi:hypothetical protein